MDGWMDNSICRTSRPSGSYAEHVPEYTLATVHARPISGIIHWGVYRGAAFAAGALRCRAEMSRYLVLFRYAIDDSLRSLVYRIAAPKLPKELSGLEKVGSFRGEYWCAENLPHVCRGNSPLPPLAVFRYPYFLAQLRVLPAGEQDMRQCLRSLSASAPVVCDVGDVPAMQILTQADLACTHLRQYCTERPAEALVQFEHPPGGSRCDFE